MLQDGSCGVGWNCGVSACFSGGRRGARYPVVVDPWIQQAELTPSDAEIMTTSLVRRDQRQHDRVGAVCHPGTSTDCAAGIQVVPEPLMCSPKAAERGVSNQELTASDGAPDDWFGNAVAWTASTVVVGAPHHMSAPTQTRVRRMCHAKRHNLEPASELRVRWAARDNFAFPSL